VKTPNKSPDAQINVSASIETRCNGEFNVASENPRTRLIVISMNSVILFCHGLIHGLKLLKPGSQSYFPKQKCDYPLLLLTMA